MILRRFILAHQEARNGAGMFAAQAPIGTEVIFKTPTRSLGQNAKFHAICDDVKGTPWYGKARDEDEWKTLFVSGHTIATGGSAEVIKGLEGEMISLRESTAAMDKDRSSSLISYTLAFCDLNAIPLRHRADARSVGVAGVHRGLGK